MGEGCESSDSTLSSNDAGCESAVEHSVCDAGGFDSGVIPKQSDDVNVDNVSESTLNKSMVLLLLPLKWSLRILVLPVRLKWTMNVKGSKRPANDDSSSDDLSPSWEDVLVSEEVANAAPRLSVVQGPALR